jgi:excisionase family DNA binding protein
MKPKIETKEKQLIDVGKASEYLCIAKSTLYALVEKNHIPYAKIGDRVVFDVNDLNTWVETKKVLAWSLGCKKDAPVNDISKNNLKKRTE